MASSARLTPRARRKARRRAPARGAPQEPLGDSLPADDPTLAELGVPARYHDELQSAEIERLSQLKARGDLTAIKGIGPKADEEIRERIAAWQAAH